MNKQIDYKSLPLLASKCEPEWKRFHVKNKKKLEGMDLQVHALHDKISQRTDCLSCANCCRSLGPRITDKDLERMAKALRIKASEVVVNYLRIDEDGDMVFKSMPCPFLGADNYCSIYESRPKACREYPHTDRRKFFQIFNLTIKNASTCPIVFEVLEELTKAP
ncbi:MAG: YkgJ family cysteine cluster protein [Paludibacter sp.]